MAKKGGGKKVDPVERRAAPVDTEVRDRGSLGEALSTFVRGDYARARVLLAAKAEDTSLSEGARAQARQLLAATRPDRGAILTGLACVGLYLIVAVITSVFQP